MERFSEKKPQSKNLSNVEQFAKLVPVDYSIIQ